MDGRWTGHAGAWWRSVDIGPEQAGQSGWPNLPAGTLLEAAYVVVTKPLPAPGLITVPGWFAGDDVGTAAGVYQSNTPPTHYGEPTTLQVAVGPGLTAGSAFVLLHVAPLGS